VLGHAVGDQQLVAVAQRLRAAVRPDDTVARLGGDEFALLLDDGRDPSTAAARIAEAFATPFDVGRQQVDVRASVGVVECEPADGRASADELLARADTAMYAAKRSGKGRTVAHSAGMSLVELEDQRLRVVLREAIVRGDVALVYQPIVELGSGRTVALEALARWSRDGCDVPPATFIAAAGRVGVLPELTGALLAEACAQLAAWSTTESALWSGTEGDPARPLAVHVNVAPSLLVDAGLVRTATALVSRHGLLPGQLVLEITESGLIADPTPAHAALAELRRAGVAISLDDFGVGNSSLSRLNDIELDSVKIDRSFVDRIDTVPRRAAFLGALLRLADDIALPVIAEGVETPSQLAELERLGCRFAQGHLLGRPAPAAAAAAWLDRRGGPLTAAGRGPSRPVRARPS
jgi:diguanylate cyclase